MIFSILRVSRDRERLFTASARHFTLCGITFAPPSVDNIMTIETAATSKYSLLAAMQ